MIKIYKDIKTISKIFKALPAISLALFLIISLGSCSIDRMLDETYLSQEEIEAVPDIEIDEYEISTITSTDDKMVKSFEAELELIPEEEGLEDPFEPFYYSGEEEAGEEEAENILILEKIYSLEGIEYADIELNGYMYKLAVGDIFNKIYQLQVINDSSVVLLKGDSLLTLFLNEIYYD